MTISPIFQQHFSTNRRNSILSRKPLYFHAKLRYYHGNCRLLRDSIILPQSPHYQRHQKRKKERPTNHSGEPLYAQKPLILSHSSILLPASTQIPMASIGNSRLCRCYTLMTFTPLYPIYPTQFDIRQTGFDKIPLLLCEIRHKMISAEFFIFIDIFPAKTYNNIRDGKPSSGEFLPDSGKLYIQESSCQIVENFINQEIPCQTVGNFKIEG